MARVDLFAPYVKKWEGGFVNDPADRGGATNMGVTIATLEAYCKRKATEAELLKHTNKRFLKGWLNRLEDIKRLS